MASHHDIYNALISGRQAAEALEGWVRRAEARDTVRGYLSAIRDGLKAYEELCRDLREGRKHIDPPDDCERSGRPKGVYLEITSEMTVAKIGQSMKKCENFIFTSSLIESIQTRRGILPASIGFVPPVFRRIVSAQTRSFRGGLFERLLLRSPAPAHRDRTRRRLATVTDAVIERSPLCGWTRRLPRYLSQFHRARLHLFSPGSTA